MGQTNVLKLLTWNINLRSNCSKRESIPSFVIEELKADDKTNNKADIIVLTEFYKVKKYPEFVKELEDAGYTVFLDPREAEENINQILIAVSNKVDVKGDFELETLSNADDSNFPDYLGLKFQIADRTINVIGIRIHTDDDFKQRCKRLDNLISHIKDKENIILLGDFNNAYFLSSKQNEDWVDAKKVSKKEYAKKRQHYNYHIVKDEFSQINCKVYTPDGEMKSWGGWVKNDHIVAAESFSLSEIRYSWQFMERSNDYSSIDPNESISWEKWSNQEPYKLGGYPDHAILTANLEIPLESHQ
jgi:exodeoxyribonuclease-3